MLFQTGRRGGRHRPAAGAGAGAAGAAPSCGPTWVASLPGSNSVSRELIGVLKLKTIFASDFKCIFICRFLPSWLLGPAAVLWGGSLWRTCGKCFLNLTLSVVELEVQTFVERTGQEERSGWEDASSPARAVTSSGGPLRDAALAESFKSEGGCGLFRIWGFGFGVLVCV